MLSRKSRGILSKKPVSITKSIITKPSSIKPLRARQLIRRFHILLKNKTLLLTKLSKLWKAQLGENDYLDTLKLRKVAFDSYNTAREKVLETLKVNKTPSTEDFKLEGLSELQLAGKLGEIDAEIAKRGGLETYQSASTQGQDSKRGGDSSKKLVQWLKELDLYRNKSTALEIGCLSSKNMISTCGIFQQVVKIDLHSQEPGLIEEQDFMERPLPKHDTDKFGLISCSLVVNFVPKPELRGQMLARFTKFLKEPTENSPSLLFFVLPLPCVSNSRYFDSDRLQLIMKNLGFECLKQHESHKLAYWLYRWKGSGHVSKNFKVGKEELHGGSKRNNFCIVMK